MCFFEDSNIYSGLSRCQCVCTHQASRTPALQQNWQSSENSKIVRKNTIFNERPVDARPLRPFLIFGINDSAEFLKVAESRFCNLDRNLRTVQSKSPNIEKLNNCGLMPDIFSFIAYVLSCNSNYIHYLWMPS